MIGKRLEHRTFGQGIVQEARHRGLELRVLFDDGRERWVRCEDVRFLSSTPVLVPLRVATRVLAEEAFRSRSMVEAFRLGIVPYGYVEDFTFGRDAEIQQIKHWLDDNDTGTVVVEGEYGSGKSHLLDYAYAAALGYGYAVARVGLDPNEAPPFKPKTVYRKLIESFRYKDGNEVKGFRDFLRAVSKQSADDLRDHYFLRRVISEIRESREDDELWNWIVGKESFRRPMLYEHGTAANVYCYILSGIGWATRLLKLKGMVVIMDEAESVNPGWYHRYQVDKGRNLIHGLVLVAANDSRLRDECIVERRQPGIGTWVGKDTGLIYHGPTRWVRYCFRLPSFVKVVLAVTPTHCRIRRIVSSISITEVRLPMLEELQELGIRILPLRLRPLSEAAFKEVYEHICSLYASAYSFLETDTDLRGCFDTIKARSQTGTRSFIKGSVEILDLRRFRPGLPLKGLK